MILPAQTIRTLSLVRPCVDAYRDELGNSAGLSACGYDITAVERVKLHRMDFRLASAEQYFEMPADVMGVVHDKSSWARRGLAVQNTVLEPGWRGYLTLELTNHGLNRIVIPQGCAIAQVVFYRLEEPTVIPYDGKYQDQERGPQEAR